MSFFSPPSQTQALSISDLNFQIRSSLEEQFSKLWVLGEISNFKAHSSGHYYFSLKDEKSQISAVMFKGSNRYLPFKIEDGLKVLVFARVSVYEPRGTYQLLIEKMELAGLGALQQAYEALKAKLNAEGLFSPLKKKKIPYLPKTVGIITSPTGAAIRDIIHVLSRRHPKISILLYPVSVQGEKASQEISQSIEDMNKLKEVDVLIVGRGGGSLEDLWAFNCENVVRAIAASDIPIISAVGHEIDYTLSDFAADLRAPTPSAAAELAVPLYEELVTARQYLEDQLHLAWVRRADYLQEKLKHLKARLKSPKQYLEDKMLRLDELNERLHQSTQRFLQHTQLQLQKPYQNLLAFSPLGVLKRGYSIVYQGFGPNKKIVSQSQSLQVSDCVQIILGEGQIDAEVRKIYEDKRN